MPLPTRTLRRLAGAAIPLVLLLPVPATAAGTGGIEVSPYPGAVNGRQVTAFHVTVPSRGAATVRYSLRNTTTHPASGRLYAASATSDGNGGYTIGEAGSSPYLSFRTRDVTLAGGELTLDTFTVHPGLHGRPAAKTYGAIVVEVRNGSVVQRAATLVYLEPGPVVPLPLLVVLVAVAVLALAGLGFLLVVRRRRRPVEVRPRL